MIDLLGFIGSMVCLYTICVEHRASRKKKDASFNEYCDLSNRISCSAVLTSKYAYMMGNLFNLPDSHPLNLSNSHYGLLYYTFIMLFPYLPIPYANWVLIALTAGSIIFSVVLSYCMFVLLKNICLMCIAIHVINVALFFIAINKEFEV